LILNIINMAYDNNGYARHKTLTVTKGSYTKAYNICAGFVLGETTYRSISDDAFAKTLR
jgi:hypothetical protein